MLAGFRESSLPPLYEFYGYTASTASGWEKDVAGFNTAGVNTFLQRTEITYEDLVELLKTRFLNPNQSIVLQAPAAASCDLTQTTIVDLAATGPTLQDLTLDHMHRFIRLWKKLGWEISELDKTITALQAADINQSFLMSLAALKQLQSALSLPLLSLLNFWANIDTDGRDSLYLSLFQNKAVLNVLKTPASKFQLNYAAPLAKLPTLSFPSPLFPNLEYDSSNHFLTRTGPITGPISADEQSQLLALSSDQSYINAINILSNPGPPIISGTSLPSLPLANLPTFLNYDAGRHQISFKGSMLESQRAQFNFSNDPAYQIAVDQLYQMRTLFGAELATVTSSPPALLSDHVDAVLAALRISAQDLNLMRTYTKLADDTQHKVPLNLTNLSALCRYAFLASGLGVAVSDLITLIDLMGVDPFQKQDPVTSLSFVQTFKTIQESPFSIAQLNYLYRHTYDPNAGIAPVPTDVSLLLTTLQGGLAKIANDNVLLPDPKGDLLRKKLAILLGDSLTGAAMGLIQGTAVYTAPLRALTGIIVPSFVSYDLAAQQLSFTGIMTAAQQTQLLGLSSDPTYQAAINTLFAESQTGGTQSVPLAGAPFLASFLAIPIFFDVQGKKLMFSGTMTSAQRSQLLGLSTDATYQTAIGNLFTASATAGSGTSFVPLAALPAGIALPDTLQRLISYDSAGQQLRFKGPMPDACQTTLLTLSTDASYQAAVKDLHQQPRDFIAKNLANFLNVNEATIQLIENPQAAAEKIAYVTQRLMPYLRQTLSRSLIKQTLSDNLQLDPKLVDLLLSTILNSQLNPGNAKAMDDFLALVGDGLSASYFPNQNLAAPPALRRIDPMVDFDWGFGLPDPSIQSTPYSVRWSGFVIPQYTEVYTFYVLHGDGVRLGVNGHQLLGPPDIQWKDQSPAEHSGTIALIAGQLYEIKLEYYDNTASAVAELRWSSPSTPKAIIPQSQLFSGSVFQSLTGIVNSYTLLHKVALLVNTFQMTADDVTYLHQHPGDFVGVDPTDPTNKTKFVPFDPNLFPLDPSGFKPALFNEWERLNSVITLRNSLPGRDAGLLSIFGAASSSTTQHSLSQGVITAIVQATGWDAAGFAFLAGSNGFALTDADFANEIGTQGTGLLSLQTCMALVDRIGVSAQQLLNWADFGPNAQADEATAKEIQSTVKAKYDDATWVTVGKPLNDTIREASKEALIAYILANGSAWNMTAPDDGGPITTSDQLYEFFLIDVDMSPCMLTSRIVQANAAVQLFVQRCLMNLEQQVSPSAIDAEWEWLKNYRVWEANRQVLLYPENWILPELRDDKTPFFKELENELLQNEITPDNVEQAYLNYLNQLDTVARLDVRGMYWQFDISAPAPDGTPDASNDVLHVFARTRNAPYTYYYRRLLSYSQYGQPGGASQWTPWEQVSIDIEGDHLIPVVWDRRLYLFWPVFKEIADPSSQGSILIPQQNATSYAPAAPQKNLQISLAWSEYKQGAWTSKQTTGEPFQPFGIRILNVDALIPYTRSLDKSKFTFRATVDSNDILTVQVYCPSGWNFEQFSGVEYTLGAFVFSGCQGGVSSHSEGEMFEQPPFANSIPFNSYFDGMGLDENTNASTLTLNYLALSPIETLSATPTLYRLMFPQQLLPNLDIPLVDPFFYQDAQRTYFVTWSLLLSFSGLADPRQENPIYSRETLSTVPQLTDTGSIFETTLSVPGGGVKLGGSDELTRVSTGNAGPRSSPMTALATTAARSRTPLGVNALGTPQLDAGAIAGQSSPSTQIQFNTFFHPHVCTFIKALNRYGVPNLLTLDNQAVTNDYGVLSGLLLSDNLASTRPNLTPGVLIAQGRLFELNNPSPGPAPGIFGASYLYFNSSIGFYYSPNPAPNTAGDAFIGSVLIPGGKAGFVRALTGSTVFEAQYLPNHAYITRDTYPRENVDFSWSGAYSIYNWELFFHIPLLIATRLSQNQKFEEAQKWFHYIFNPTSNSVDSPPQRYWKFLPFYECSPWDEIEGQIANLLFPPPPGGNGTPPALCGQDTHSQIEAWKHNPFNPHLIARMRTVAYRMKVVMAYIDNLIAWGDYLFGQNTRESINEATQLYVLAKECLGLRPTLIPPRGDIQDYTYNDLTTLYSIDALSNALVQMENDFPYISVSGTSGSSGLGSALSMASTVPYFCIPPNSTLLGYWDTVEDRLYKIRHCMNIQGVVEQLPLFAPPISPALLVQAEAMGVDLSSVLSNINAATPFYRFSFMVEKALELCAEVRSLGAALLSALEKKDAEALSILRATQESGLLKAMRQMRQSQLDESNATLAGLQASPAVWTFREGTVG